MLALGGCSTLPNAYNPAEWVKDAQGWFDSDQKKAADDQRQAKEKLRANEAAAEPQAFPKLASVPDPPKSSTPSERKKIADSLVADRANARYTEEVLRRQTDSPIRSPGAPGLRTALSPTPDRAPAAQAVVASAPPPEPKREAAPEAVRQMAPEPMRQAPPERPPPVVEQAPAPPAAPAQSGPAAVESRAASQATSRTAPVEPVEVAPPPPPAPPMLATRNAAVPAPTVPAGSGAPAQVAALPPTARDEPPAPPVPPPAVLPPPAAEPVAEGPGRGRAATQVSSRIPDPAPSVATLPPPASAQPPPGAADGQQIATVLFDDGSADITPGAAKLLERVVALHRSRGGQLRVVGHASIDVPGGDALHKRLVNFRVSTDRANAVARELVRLGIDPAAISVVAVSESQPLYNERVPAGEAGNRRAEIYFEQRG